MRKKLAYVLANFEDLLIALFFTNMCIFIGLQIVARFFFNSAILFAEEISRYSYVWICFIGMAVGVKMNNHIKVDVVFLVIKDSKAQKIITLVINLISVGLYLMLAIIGIQYTSANYEQLSPAMELSKGFIYISIPLGALLAVLRFFPIIQGNINELRKG